MRDDVLPGLKIECETFISYERLKGEGTFGEAVKSGHGEHLIT